MIGALVAVSVLAWVAVGFALLAARGAMKGERVALDGWATSNENNRRTIEEWKASSAKAQAAYEEVATSYEALCGAYRDQVADQQRQLDAAQELLKDGGA